MVIACTSLFQNVYLITRNSFYVALKIRDHWEQLEGKPALVTAVTFSTHAPEDSPIVVPSDSHFKMSFADNVRTLGTRSEQAIKKV